MGLMRTSIVAVLSIAALMVFAPACNEKADVTATASSGSATSAPATTQVPAPPPPGASALTDPQIAAIVVAANLKSTLVGVKPAFDAHLEHAEQLQATLAGTGSASGSPHKM